MLKKVINFLFDETIVSVCKHLNVSAEISCAIISSSLDIKHTFMFGRSP